MVCENCSNIVTEPHEIYSTLSGETMTLCGACAEDMGFCMLCGYFMAGSEIDEHSGVKGVCYACVQENQAEMTEYGDYDDNPPY